MIDKIIPPAVEGKNTDVKHELTCTDVDAARQTYEEAVKRMLHPGVWHEVAGAASATLTVVSAGGADKAGPASEGDFVKINIPGPAPSKGDGYDWVRVEKIASEGDTGSEEESCGMTLRPTAPPDSREHETTHFFTSEATSTFVIHRAGNQLTATYHGRNEIPNTEAEKTRDTIRNSVVALGAMVGLSELQWKVLIKGFLESDVVV